MLSESPSKRPGVASTLGPMPTEASNDAPQWPRRLVVEVYAPPAARVSSPPAVKTVRWGRSGWHSSDLARRGFVGSVVVALHVALGAWLLTTSGKTDSLPSVLPPLEVLPVIQAAPTRESLAGVSVQLSPVSIDPTPVPSPTLPRLSAIEAAPPEMAISISFATDVVITAANADDGATVARRCATREASRRAAPLSFQDMSILIRVETDGRVSDSRIETSSGDARADADAERCLRVYGAFHPARSQGQPIASWQRLRWVAGGLDRSS